MANVQKLEVDIGDLDLDLENPRTGRVESQSDALAAIVRLNARNFKNMMQSIKEHGLDPGDSFYLVQENEDDDPYTVVDGNRRLAALKVLSQPDLLQGTDLSDATIGLRKLSYILTLPIMRRAGIFITIIISMTTMRTLRVAR